MEAIAAELEEFCSTLTREPDFDAAELRAYDTADLLALTTAAERIRGAQPGTVVTVGDRHGALTLGAAAVLGATGVRAYQDPLLAERALAQNAARLDLAGSYSAEPLGETLLAGAETVLVQLPRGLEALEEIAWKIARFAPPDVRVFAAGRVKHMTLAQNEVLAKYFGEVAAGLGWRKSRVVQAAGPTPQFAGAEPPFPKWGADRELPFGLAAFGATFGGTKLDHGSRLLLSTFAAGQGRDAWGGSPGRTHIFDLGCGSGVLAVSAALALPSAAVIASDQSDAAVRSTALTAGAAGVAGRVAIHRADGAEAVADGWADLVLLNPPFHTGATVHAGVGQRLIRDCARVLRPGGELRIVFNSHLGYRPLLEQAIGPVRQLARDATFTVLSVTRR
ncbi:class I SAM-dependent methyltransferase [Leucobacter albus]|uniref:Class I SAM-dependent methyltransferase n=1 Tax=Leucobacter albus TaxID=272210 RepID=A0ABW3TQV2_9MICO